MGDNDNNNDFVANGNTVDNTKLTVYPFDMTMQNGQSNYDTSTVSIPSIVQHTAVDDSTSSGAGYATFVKYDNKDAVAKFLSTQVTTTNGNTSTTTNPGTTQWVVTSDDLIKLVTKQVTGTEASNTTGITLNFKAMLHSAGGNSSPPSLFVLASIDGTSGSENLKGSYLFQINWNLVTTNDITGDKNSGSYRLAAILSKDSTNINDYNFLVMDGVSTNSMEVLQLGDINNSTSDYTGNYVNVSNSLFNSKTETATSHTITFSNFSSFVQSMDGASSSPVYKPIYVNNINSRFFFIFQSNSTTLDGKSLLLVRSDLLTNNVNTNIAISQASNYQNIDFSSIGLTTGSKLFNTLIYYNSKLSSTTAVINIVVSIPNQTKYGYASFDAIAFSQVTAPVAYEYSGFSTSGFISQIVPYYSLNDYQNVYGYYALTSTNQVLKLDANFKYVSEMYDFSSSIYNVGTVYNIYTLSGSDLSSVWYAQMTDGKFVKMNDSNLVGQWDSLYSSDSYEKAGDFIFKSQNEVDSSVLFKRVVNSNGGSFDTDFISYINSTTSWKDFLTVVSTDGQITTDPSVTVSIYNYDSSNPSNNNYYFGDSATNPLNPNTNNTITLVFTQNLRKISAGGNVTQEYTTMVIGSYTYTFYYGVGTINNQNEGTNAYTDYDSYTQLTKLTIPQYVLDMYPSQIVSLINSSSSGDSDNYNFITTFLNMQNIVNPTITASGDDISGTLTINVAVPYYWRNNALSASSGTWIFTYGNSTSPFFKYNRFGFASDGSSNASVTPVDSTYAANSSNSAKVKSLTDKYSTKLPSQITAKNYYDDFLVLGSAFLNSSNVANGSIVLPTFNEDGSSDNVTIVPNDKDGNAFVSITFPKIDPNEDYTVSFTTPSIFMKDASASQSVYFGWKSASQVTQIDTKDISSLSASSIANTFNGNTKDKIAMLQHFAVFSDYYSNLIVQKKLDVKATYDDRSGFLTLSLSTTDTNTSLPGISSTNLSATFTGFQQNTSTGSTNISTNNQTSSFSFGTGYSADANRLPSSVTQSEIISSALLSNNANLSTWVANGLATITLTPSNVNGILEVEVVLKNYSENGSISSTKTFTRAIGGFATGDQSSNMIVWKTNTNSAFLNNNSAKLPSALVTTATSGEFDDTGTSSSTREALYRRLTYFADLSSDLNAELEADPSLVKAVTLQADDTLGTLVVTAVILQKGQLVEYSTTISGLGTTSLLQPTITFNAEDGTSNNAALTALRQLIPSEAAQNNALLTQLFSISNSSDNYKIKTSYSYDNYTGTLTLNVSVLDPTTNTVLQESSKTYTGFARVIDTSVGTNWAVVAASAIVPMILLIIPVVVFGYIQQRRDMKTIAKKLSTRLQEEQERKRRMQRRQQLLAKTKNF
ncbi:conserved hypothetical protein [Malacoplasma penetrans HF-2]|uniref:Lipoprotein-associated type-17 domain-containing protein n=2 Tax=Malacoplasma penetrans TaxID=28227 RepID=Q8EUY9_MALP2|nr:conserved hypothetical protein [Malacoplasma penetrans HF-2]